MALADLLAQAARVGLTLTVDRDGLAVRGPRTAAPLARALLDGRREQLADWLDSGRVALDWRGDHTARLRGRCRYCGQSTFLIDDDQRPAHKICTEQHLWRLLSALYNERGHHRE